MKHIQDEQNVSLSREAPALPELLAPVGSPEALEAALAAGADAVYLGGRHFNARMHAHNFDAQALAQAVARAHSMGVRVYLTLNTLIYDRELPDALDAAYEAASAGVDALIIADLGAAAMIHKAIPSLPLHASTQLSGHNAGMGQVLAPYGFTRYVMARETALPDLVSAVRQNPLEVEVFVHGALCVCHSGQCLFSSMIGGRSGNRGECAQPCRLPYTGCIDCAGRMAGTGASRAPRPEQEVYPLSLKDLSLARHIPALLEAGVSSLKIEGRMKSAAYVGGVTSIWRRLLDQRRAATEEEMQQLSALFSRGGFTDAYFTGRVGRDTRTVHDMMGIRTVEDKQKTATVLGDAAAQSAAQLRAPGRLPLTITATVKAGEPLVLTASAPLFVWQPSSSAEAQASVPASRSVSVTVQGEAPDIARTATAALTPETLLRQLSKTGGTAYHLEPDALTAHVAPSCMVPLSRLNTLRREALDALDQTRLHAIQAMQTGATASDTPWGALTPDLLTTSEASAASPASDAPCLTARFHRPEQITPTAEAYFSLCYLPLSHWVPGPAEHPARGVLLPPVMFDSEAPTVADKLRRVLCAGARDIMISNPGQWPMVGQVLQQVSRDGIPPEAITLHGDFRLNATNAPAVTHLFALCASASRHRMADLLLSPELTLPRLRDLCRAFHGQVQAIVYGRIPLMLLEKCVMQELFDGAPTRAPRHAKPRGSQGTGRQEACAACAADTVALRDRRGVLFPVIREAEHRNLVLNSLPLSMLDRPDDLARASLSGRHFLFTTEQPAEIDCILHAAVTASPLPFDVRRYK